MMDKLGWVILLLAIILFTIAFILCFATPLLFVLIGFWKLILML